MYLSVHLFSRVLWVHLHTWSMTASSTASQVITQTLSGNDPGNYPGNDPGIGRLYCLNALNKLKFNTSRFKTVTNYMNRTRKTTLAFWWNDCWHWSFMIQTFQGMFWVQWPVKKRTSRSWPAPSIGRSRRTPASLMSCSSKSSGSQNIKAIKCSQWRCIKRYFVKFINILYEQ